MKRFSARFFNADDCDFALCELKRNMKVSNSLITYIYANSSGDLPVNYPDTPIADYSSAEYLDGKEHIAQSSNVNYDYNEFAEKQSVRLNFTVSDKNSKKASQILLKFRAFDIKSGY